MATRTHLFWGVWKENLSSEEETEEMDSSMGESDEIGLFRSLFPPSDEGSSSEEETSRKLARLN